MAEVVTRRAALLGAAILLVAVAAVAATRRLEGLRAGGGSLPVYGDAPAFALVDQSGREVRSETLLRDLRRLAA